MTENGRGRAAGGRGKGEGGRRKKRLNGCPRQSFFRLPTSAFPLHSFFPPSAFPLPPSSKPCRRPAPAVTQLARGVLGDMPVEFTAPERYKGAAAPVQGIGPRKVRLIATQITEGRTAGGDTGIGLNFFTFSVCSHVSISFKPIDVHTFSTVNREPTNREPY